jgi:hypothetical protein
MDKKQSSKQMVNKDDAEKADERPIARKLLNSPKKTDEQLRQWQLHHFSEEIP